MGDLLLRILEAHQGRFVSGEEIGRRIGTSRAAVWKQVRILRRRGFGIEGARVPASRAPRSDRGDRRSFRSFLPVVLEVIFVFSRHR